MDNLYKQAIVDAKAVRASAIANAKANFHEAIEPQIQEMMRLKLSEDLEEDLEEDMNMPKEEGYDHKMEEEMDDATLEEILDELNSLEEDDDADMADVNDVDVIQEAEEEEETEVSDDMGGEEVSDSTEIKISLGDLKNAIEQLYKEKADGEESEELEVDDEEGGEDAKVKDEETISLDEVLAELAKDEAMNEDQHEEMKPVKGKAAMVKEKKDMKKDDKDMEDKIHEMQDELEEAQDAIITLNETLKELNLLNAKLLFANKILRAKNLSESEKSRVVKAFDRTRTVKETKNTYSTLMESLSNKKAANIQPLKESIGFASKPAGVANTQTPIVESNEFLSRWQKIAGIK